MSGLKINYNKSVLYGVGVETPDIEAMAEVLNCKPERTPFLYLGLLVGANMNRISNWQVVVDVFDKRLSGWKARTLSIGGRLTLIKSVLEAIPCYYFSLYKAPVKDIEILEAKRRRFLWGGNSNRQGSCWIAWEKVLAQKKDGDLGLCDLKTSNIALLTRWWWRYKTETEGLWRSSVKAIHHTPRTWPAIPLNKSLSGTWSNIAKIDNLMAHENVSLLKASRGIIGNGREIRFWVDPWLNEEPLRVLFPNLYAAEAKKGCVVADRLVGVDGRLFNWDWKHPLVNHVEAVELFNLILKLQGTVLSNVKDRWKWMLDETGVFRWVSSKECCIILIRLPDTFV